MTLLFYSNDALSDASHLLLTSSFFIQMYARSPLDVLLSAQKTLQDPHTSLVLHLTWWDSNDAVEKDTKD